MKNIRPLTAFKREHPEYYAIVMKMEEGETSKKDSENSFYWWYCRFEMKNIIDAELREKDTFFWNGKGDCANKGTVTELGRLLLTAWYYGVEDFGKEVAKYVYNAYHKRLQGTPANDLEFKDLTKHIRVNFRYYYNNQDELKLYILENFFKDELTPLLPEKPKELRQIDDTIDFLLEVRKNNKKKGVDYWITEASKKDDYIYYLQSVIEDIGVQYQSESDFKSNSEVEDNAFWEKYEEMKKEHKANILNNTKALSLI